MEQKKDQRNQFTNNTVKKKIQNLVDKLKLQESRQQSIKQNRLQAYSLQNKNSLHLQCQIRTKSKLKKIQTKYMSTDLEPVFDPLKASEKVQEEMSRIYDDIV